MRRASLLTSLAGTAVLAVAGLGSLDLFADRPAKPEPDHRLALASRSESAAKLPVAHVVLFNSGVGYFQREGEIDGNCRVDLSFPVQDVNDILKSLVLQDFGGGQINAVSFDSQAPIERTLHSFAVDLSGNPTLGQILFQARGEKVEVVLQQSQTSQPGTLTGALVGIEAQKVPAGKDGAIDVEAINLWCAEGMRQVKLGDVQRIRFLNPVMESEFRKALEIITLSHDTQKKAVTLNFTGEGKRPVRVGYVAENPIWKTSYRLVLDKEKKPFLQSWAVVENETDEDWNQVTLTLVSGRPISFRMDLYTPLYVPRPIVEPELFASLRPPTYTGPLEVDRSAISDVPGQNNLGYYPPAGGLGQQGALGTFGQQGALGGGIGALGALGAGGLGALGAGGFGALGGGGIGGGLGGGLPVRPAQTKRPGPGGQPEDKSLDLRRGIAESGKGVNFGDAFQYRIDQPTTLGRQKSAMLPIVNKPVEGQRVSIYDHNVHEKYPLLGLKFKNTTGLPLTQGPITVFDGNNYAGDARILDLQPNEERLLSFAIDLGLEVEPAAHVDNGPFTRVKIQKGVLFTTTRHRESITYTIKSRSQDDRVLLIEHPRHQDFHLTSEQKPVERTENVYRFRVVVKKGETVKQVVNEEKDVQQTVQLTNLDDKTMRVLFSDVAISPALKEAVRTATAKKRELAKTEQEVENLHRELVVIKGDQPRLRDNLARIPGTDPLAKRILEKLNKQETEIEQYEEQVKKLNARADQQRREYEEYLAGLNIE